MVGPHLELGVHPEEEEDVAGECGGGMAGGEARHGGFEGGLVGVGAYVDGVHDVVEADAVEPGCVVGCCS